MPRKPTSLLFFAGLLILGSNFPSTGADPLVKFKHLESVSYPEVARNARIQGEVRILARIGTEGTITSADVQSGDPLLAPTAARNVKRWTFEKGSERRVEITFEFVLQDPAIAQKPDTRTEFDLPAHVLVISSPPVPLP
ncbi:MAG TPA: TonB family protein [Candidatus Acidoferrales bacterium]|nr:TonB family protein [Candidatus Acidoferrales bacterium]